MHPRKRALTLVELMVTCSVFLTLSVILVSLMRSSMSVAEKGSLQVRSQHVARLAMRQLSNYLETAVAPDAGRPALLAPVPGTRASLLRFYSCDDFVTVTPQPPNPRRPAYRLYGVAMYAPDELRLTLFSDDGTTAARPLCRGITNFTVDNLDGASVRVNLTAHEVTERSVQGKNFHDQSLTSILPLPYGN